LLIALSKKLQGRFPTHGVANNLGVVYPQYWLHLDVEVSFS
jgi:hypothetical protein